MPISALYNFLLKKVHKMQSNVTPLASKLSKSVIFLSVALPSANFSRGKGVGERWDSYITVTGTLIRNFKTHS